MDIKAISIQNVIFYIDTIDYIVMHVSDLYADYKLEIWRKNGKYLMFNYSDKEGCEREYYRILNAMNNVMWGVSKCS